MKSTDVLIRPILTEKANAQQEKLRRYAFKVNTRANKLEIKKAVEAFLRDHGSGCEYGHCSRARPSPGPPRLVWSLAANRDIKKP